MKIIKSKIQKSERGQALVTLLIFVMMGLAIATAASFIVAINSQAATSFQEGTIARQMADSGIETAYLKILRNGISYTGETLNFDGGTVAINVTWSGTNATIESVATNTNYIKKVESHVSYSDNDLVEVSWKETN